jgi:hypothetical protein
MGNCAFKFFHLVAMNSGFEQYSGHFQTQKKSAIDVALI